MHRQNRLTWQGDTPDYWQDWCGLAAGLLFFSFVAVLANLQPTPFGGQLFLNGGDQRHGLPLVYMERAETPPWAGGLTVIHGPWPFIDATPALIGFSWAALLIDAAVALFGVAASTSLLVRWLRSRGSVVRNLVTRAMMLVAGMWGIVIAHSLNTPTSFWEIDAAEAMFLLWILPGIDYLALLLLVYAASVRWLLRPARVSASQLAVGVCASLATIGFVIYVLGERLAVLRSLDFMTLGVALLLSLAAGRAVAAGFPAPSCWRYRRSLCGNAGWCDRLLALWVALIVGATGVFFGFLEQTEGFYSEIGGSYSYGRGWPWMYLLEPEPLADSWLARFSYVRLAADVVVLYAGIYGNLLIVQAVVHLRSLRVAFGLRRLLQLMAMVAIPLALFEPNGRDVWWTNGYVQAVSLIELVGVGYFVTQLPRLVRPNSEKAHCVL